MNRFSSTYFKGRNFRGQKFSRVKKTREIYGINFRVSRFLEQISWKKLSRIEKKFILREKTFANEQKKKDLFLIFMRKLRIGLNNKQK